MIRVDRKSVTLTHLGVGIIEHTSMNNWLDQQNQSWGSRWIIQLDQRHG